MELSFCTADTKKEQLLRDGVFRDEFGHATWDLDKQGNPIDHNGRKIDPKTAKTKKTQGGENIPPPAKRMDYDSNIPSNNSEHSTDPNALVNSHFEKKEKFSQQPQPKPFKHQLGTDQMSYDPNIFDEQEHPMLREPTQPMIRRQQPVQLPPKQFPIKRLPPKRVRYTDDFIIPEDSESESDSESEESDSDSEPEIIYISPKKSAKVNPTKQSDELNESFLDLIYEDEKIKQILTLIAGILIVWLLYSILKSNPPTFIESGYNKVKNMFGGNNDLPPMFQPQMGNQSFIGKMKDNLTGLWGGAPPQSTITYGPPHTNNNTSWYKNLF